MNTLEELMQHITSHKAYNGATVYTWKDKPPSPKAVMDVIDHEVKMAKMEAIDSMLNLFTEQQKHLGQVCIDSEGTQGCSEANDYVWLIGEISKYKSKQKE